MFVWLCVCACGETLSRFWGGRRTLVTSSSWTVTRAFPGRRATSAWGRRVRPGRAASPGPGSEVAVRAARQRLLRLYSSKPRSYAGEPRRRVQSETPRRESRRLQARSLAGHSPKAQAQPQIGAPSSAGSRAWALERASQPCFFVRLACGFIFNSPSFEVQALPMLPSRKGLWMPPSPCSALPNGLYQSVETLLKLREWKEISTSLKEGCLAVWNHWQRRSLKEF